MAVEDVQMGENSSGGRSPMDRDIPTSEIGTPAPQGRDTRTIEKLRGDVNGMMREIDDIKVLASKSEKRQVLIDAFHEEPDKLQMQIAGVSSEVLSKETIVDMSSAVVQSYDLSQIESNKNRDEEVERIMDAFEKVKTETRECMDRVREEIQDSVDAGTAEITARTNKIVENESEIRRKSFKKVDETLGATVSRVDGLQESIVRCRNELSGVQTMFADFRRHYDDCVPKEEYRKGLVSTERALESIRTRVKDLEVRTTLRSDDVPSALRSTDEEKQRVIIRREIDEISSAIKAMSQRLGDNNERTTKGTSENKESVERLRSAMRKVVEIINSERQGNKELALKIDRKEKAAVETEIAINRRFEKVSADIIELRRDFVEAGSGSRTVGDGKRPSDGHGETLAGNGNQMVLFRKVGDLENRIEANESTNQRQETTIQGHIAEIRGEISDLKTLCRVSRDGTRGATRSRSSSVEPSGWRERLDGIRQNVDEVSASTGKTQEDTRKLTERMGTLERENVQLREEIRAADLEIKRVDIAMSDLAKENARLNDRIVSLVSLGEEGQKRTTILEDMVTAMRKELTEVNNRCNENRDDIRIVKATIASAPGATSGVGMSRKGVQEDGAASEASASTLPAMAADGQHSLGKNTPAPSACGGGHAGRRDVSRGRDADSVTLGSGGLLGADYRQRREQCDLCGEYSDERDMHPCPR